MNLQINSLYEKGREDLRLKGIRINKVLIISLGI